MKKKLGRQKGFFIEAVIGYLISNISELYRIDKIKETDDSVLYTKVIKVFRKDNIKKQENLNYINKKYAVFQKN